MSNDSINSILNTLSEKERKYALEILKEYSDKGSSETYNNLIYEDYEEVPVDITEFLHNPIYLGKGLINEEGKFTVYDYWVDTLKKIFPDPLQPAQYNTLALTGAIGLGKSFMAVLCALYELYRMLCLKDPYIHYGLQPIDKISFAIMNITLDAAQGVGWDKLQQLAQSSEWFLAHGELSKSNNPVWSPGKKIELICGSLSRHIIGRAVFFCLDGETEILTNFGDKKLKELVDAKIKVATVNSLGDIEYSEQCTVKPTAIQTEEYEIELEDGTIVKCTPEHRFLLTNGTYKEAQHLTEQDDIFYVSPQKSDYAAYIDGILSSRGRCIDDKNVYRERHHIIPKCCNGSNEESNLIELLPEEHYIAHYFLAKENPDNYKLGLALNCMLTLNRCNDFIKDSITYKDARLLSMESLRISSSGSNGGMYQKTPWNKGLTKETDARVRTYAEKCSKTKAGIKKGPDSLETRKRKSEALRIRYKLHPETFVGCNKGKIAITDGINTLFINKEDSLPEGYEYGNSRSRGPHNLQNYYSNQEMIARRKKSCSGSNNPNYGHGERQSGGKNGKAIYNYWYDGNYFECRKYLLNYLNSIGIQVSENTLRIIQNGTYGKRTEKKYPDIIKNMSWRLKNEN